MQAKLKLALCWLEAHGRWNHLRSLGSSNLVKASVLMPAFGYMLLLNDNVHQYLTIKYDGWLLNHLPAVWRIWLLFYGSFLLATATILYSAFCPASIKRYQSSFTMADAEREHHLHLYQFQRIKEGLLELYNEMSKLDKTLTGTPPINFEDPSFKGKDAGTQISNMLVFQWTLQDMSRPVLRISILVLFSIGLGLLAIPAIFTFVQVTALAVRRAFS